MRFCLILFLTLGVVSCLDSTKRVEYNPGKSSKTNEPQLEERKDETEETLPVKSTPPPEKSKRVEEQKNKETKPIPEKKPVADKKPGPVKKPVVDNTKNKEKVRDHIEQTIETTSIYCMTRLEPNALQDLNNAPTINVLYLKVNDLIISNVASLSRIEFSELRKKDLSAVNGLEVKSFGETLITKLSEGRGISLKFIPPKHDFIASELEFKIYKNDCLEDDCINNDNYRTPFFNAEVASFLYLKASEYPTQYLDNQASCYFSQEALDVLAPYLY